MATGALVCALVNFVVPILIPAIVALVLAAQATGKIKRSGGALTGLGLVKAARIIAVIALVVNLLGAAGLTYLISEAVDEAQENGFTGTTSVFLLGVGDCFFYSPSEAEVFDVEVVNCAEPHFAEVIANIELPDGEFPGEAAVDLAAENDCRTAFLNYVGLPPDESEFALRFLVVTEQSWAQGDRGITCLVSHAFEDGRLEGSVRGTGL